MCVEGGCTDGVCFGQLEIPSATTQYTLSNLTSLKASEDRGRTGQNGSLSWCKKLYFFRKNHKTALNLIQKVHRT